MGTKIKFSNKGMSAKPASVSSVVFEVPVYLQSWASQATWYIDPSAGDDNNNGATSTTALKTFSEVARRLPILTQPVTINYVGTTNPASTDVISWQPVFAWSRALGATVPNVTINGIETAGILPAGATGVVNAASNPVGNTPPRLSDTGGAGVVWPVGTCIRVTSGASAGAWTCVVKDEGGGVARVAPWTGANLASIAAPLNGSTYQVVTYTQIPDLAVYGNGPIAFRFNFCQFLAFTPGAGTSNIGNVVFVNCVFASGANCSAVTALSRLQFLASYLKFGQSFASNNGAYINMQGCGIDRTGATSAIRCQYAGVLTISNCIIQGQVTGKGIACSQQGSDFTGGGYVRITDLGIYDTGSGPAVWVTRGGSIEIASSTNNFGLYGSNNATGTQVIEGGRVFVQTGLTPTLAATGTELQIDALANAIPALTGGAGVPAASALATWVNWNAAPFSRNVVNYTNGSSIIAFT
jgi:hypothetical protein